MVTHDDLRGLFAAWSAALQTGDPDAVVGRYATDAVLLPALSDRRRVGTIRSIVEHHAPRLIVAPTGTR